MRTITLDILDDNALNLLKDLELLKVIRLRRDNQPETFSTEDLVKKYKGSMVSQSKEEIDNQLESLRNEWE
ncbi:hypothetical protein EZ449_18735 [Pedobacter frigidisoli]|uniref:Uncharacterized protein n=1 Tax=Pedobacter frigidisoli TaxID=2530455 RepID=A0A4R0NSL0_9SPHI|nr:hypothetical protein [Pedobacter frigidisoli]TCD02395.1 hypothetical protein EZ449_18735 [Pedobacter frigidisoli]